MVKSILKFPLKAKYAWTLFMSDHVINSLKVNTLAYFNRIHISAKFFPCVPSE